MQRSLILGATGFIGGNLVRSLVARGESPRILIRRTSSLSFLEDILDRIEIVYGDFQDNAALCEATKHIDVIYHLISTTSPSSTLGNSYDAVLSDFLSTVRLVENSLVNGVKKIVYASSGGTVYGEPQITPIPEDHPLLPKSVYGQSKLSIENYLNFHARLMTLDVNILRISNPFGPGQNPAKAQGIIAVALNCAYSSRVLKLYGNSEAVRDYLYIDDVSEALILAAQKPGSSIVNISSGMGYSVRDIVETIEEVSGRIILKEFIPARSSDVSVSILSNQRAFEIYGWTPKVGLKEGLFRFDKMMREKMTLTPVGNCLYKNKMSTLKAS